MAFTVALERDAHLGPFNGKIFKCTSAGSKEVITTGLNVNVIAAIQIGGTGATATTGNAGSFVLNSNDGTAGTSTGNIYPTNTMENGTIAYVWVLF